jgi:hypothetical protein
LHPLTARAVGGKSSLGVGLTRVLEGRVLKTFVINVKIKLDKKKQTITFASL